MSTSLVHVLTVIGKGAVQVEAACEELLSRRVARGPGYGSLDWTDRDHEDLEHLCVALINAARNLPVLYYAQYLDPWTVGNSMFQLMKYSDGRMRRICGSDFDLVFYPSRFSKEFLHEIDRWRQTEDYRKQSEDRWYLDHVGEAIASVLWLDGRFLVLSISETLGASRLDDEVQAALEVPIQLPMRGL